jgi:hypothetical protein
VCLAKSTAAGAEAAPHQCPGRASTSLPLLLLLLPLLLLRLLLRCVHAALLLLLLLLLLQSRACPSPEVAHVWVVLRHRLCHGVPLAAQRRRQRSNVRRVSLRGARARALCLLCALCIVCAVCVVCVVCCVCVVCALCACASSLCVRVQGGRNECV